MVGYVAVLVFILYIFIALVTGMVMYHHVAYAISMPNSKIILSIIIVGSIGLTLTTFFVFIAVPWSEYDPVIRALTHSIPLFNQ